MGPRLEISVECVKFDYVSNEIWLSPLGVVYDSVP